MRSARGPDELTTGGLRVYLEAMQETLCVDGIYYAQLMKIYGAARGKGDERRYSPAE